MKKTTKLFWIILTVLAVLSAGVATAVCFRPGQDTGSTAADASPEESPDGLPRLYLEGDISDMASREDIRSVSVRYEAGSKSFAGFAELKIQGGTSLGFAKKNYTIKLYRDEAHLEKLKVDLGWGQESRYCLKANWVDKTHSRNIVTANLVAEAQKKYGILDNTPNNGAIDGFPIEIYSNGTFLGLYTFNIPKDAWLFAMDSKNPNHIVMESLDWNPTNLFLEKADFVSWDVEVGTKSKATLEKFNRVFDFVLNSSDREFREHFTEYIDLDAALNYCVFTEVAYLCDNVGKNMLMVTYDGQVWYPCLYDMDTSWGTWWDGRELVNYRRDTMDMTDNNLFRRIRENFGKELADRYFELREEILSGEHILGEFNAFRAQIPPAVFADEASVWGHSIPGYGISQIEEYLNIMLPRLDIRYSALRDRG